MRQRQNLPLSLGAALAVAGALALSLAIAGPAAAQTSTSSIRGVVRDASGPVPAAKVEAVDTASGFRYSATAGADGSFSLPGLTPGIYKIEVSSEAYSPQSRTVQVLVGQDVTADFVLSPSEVFTENVTVVGENVDLLVETRTSEVATNVTTQQIENLPQNSRNFLSFAALAPGVRFTDDQDQAGQKFRSGGADARQVNVFIDGLSYKNDLLQGGAFMQDSSRGNPFPQNAVQEYRVLTQNYKAEYEKAAAAVITAVTKSGGNSFNGDVFYFYQDKDLVTQDDFSKDRGEDKPDYERKQSGLSLGGPIVHDRLHFFVSYEGNKQDRNATVFRGSSYPFAPANVQQRLAGEEVGTLTAPFDSDLYFGKLTWQPGLGQSFSASYTGRDESEVHGFGGQQTRDVAEDFQVGTDALIAKHQLVLGNALNELTGSWQKLEWNPTALITDVPRQNYIGILDVGGKDATQDFQQDRVGLRDDLTYALSWHGEHALKAGAGYNHADYKVEKRLFDNPLFEFRSDEGWQFPFQARIGFGNPGLDFSNDQAGLYLQDDWQLGGHLTLNLGMRWDYESNMINNDYETPPQLVAALRSACRTYAQPVGGRTTWCLPDFLDFSRYTTDGNDRPAYYGMVQPRLGFAWDVQEDGRTVVFGGWGKYYDRIILNDIFDEQYRQSWSIYNFCFSADGGPAPNCGVPAIQWQPQYLSAAGLRGLIASGVAAGPEVWLVANDLKPPRSNQWTVGVRRQFGRWLTSASYAGSRGYNGLSYFFGDLPPGTAFGERFGGNVTVPGYARVFVTSTARRTWYDGLFLTLDKPFLAGSRWGLDFAYTYAKAYQNGTDNPFEGIAFGAFDYLTSADYFKFPGTNDERHRVVASGTVALPWSLQLSSLITLGSGTPFTIFDDSVAPFTVRWNEGRPEKKDFIIPNAWAYRSVDLRLEWQAPPIRDVTLALVGEAFNIFDFDNFGCFENFKPRLPGVNPRFGQGNCEFNTRRLQAGARVRF
jgi:outer membrane receptor protein involved in Fe transport